MTLSTPTNREEKEHLLTGTQLLAMGDSGRCELIEGRIVVLSPTKMQHGRYEFHFAKLLDKFVEKHHLGEVMVGEVGIYIKRNPDTIRAADILFISDERLAQATPDDFLDVAPELVVEIMSPSDRWLEVRKKLRDYFSIDISVVLVVEPDDEIVSLFRSPTDVQEFTKGDELVIEDVLPGLRLPIVDLFAIGKGQ